MFGFSSGGELGIGVLWLGVEYRTCTSSRSRRIGVRGGGGGVVAAAAAGGGAVAEAVDAQTGPRKPTAAHHESKSAPPSTCLRHSMFAQNP